jgi:hypothetical protein
MVNLSDYFSVQLLLTSFTHCTSLGVARACPEELRDGNPRFLPGNEYSDKQSRHQVCGGRAEAKGQQPALAAVGRQ